MRQRFESVYAPLIERYLTAKTAAGLTTKAPHSTLMMFDRLCRARGEQAIGVTPDLGDAWCRKRSNESESTLRARIGCLRGFAEFLDDLGYDSVIPPVLGRGVSRGFTPYIFTEAQMTAVFTAADAMIVDGRPNSTLPAVPALLRFLYATALRVGEATSLAVADVDLEAMTVLVRESKNGQDRLVPFTASTAEMLACYRATIRFHQDRGEPFFVRGNGLACDPGRIYRWFKRILANTGIPHLGTSKGPRVHDIRHTAAVHALAWMVRRGDDVYCALPVLSRYLGHQSLAATDEYVRLTADMYPDLVGSVADLSSYVFPEATHVRTD